MLCTINILRIYIVFIFISHLTALFPTTYFEETMDEFRNLHPLKHSIWSYIYDMLSNEHTILFD